MALKFKIRYKSGVEEQYVHKLGNYTLKGNIREMFNSYLKTGKQDTFEFEFCDRNDNVLSNNIKLDVDFRDVSSVSEYEI